MTVDVRQAVVGASTMALINLCWMLGVGALAVGPLGSALAPIGVAAAITSAVVGGLLVTLLAQPRAHITASSSSVVVVYAALAAHLTTGPDAGRSLTEIWALLSLTVVVAGLLLIMVGTLRACDAVNYLPLPVSIGFVGGIGLLVMNTQVPSLLGGSPGLLLSGKQLWAAVDSFRPGALFVGLLAAAITWRAPRHRWSVYGPLVALVAGTAVHHLLARLSGSHQVGPTLGAIDLAAGVAWTAAALPLHISFDWLGQALLEVLPFALLLAFQAAMNGAVSCASLDAVLSTRSSLHKILQAQGVANILCGCLGTLPVCTNAPLSVMAVRFAPHPRMIVLTCGLLLLCVLAAAAMIAHLPLAAFAGVLVVSGARMIDARIGKLVERIRRDEARGQAFANLLVITMVAGFTVSGNVILGIALGLGAETLILAKFFPVRKQRKTTFDHAKPDQTRALAQVVRLGETVFFGNVTHLSRSLSQLPAGTTHLVLDMSRTDYMDLTAFHAIEGALERNAVVGIKTLLCGVDRDRRPQHSLHQVAPSLMKWPCFANAELALATLEARARVTA